MITTTKPAVHTSRNYSRATTTLGEFPMETAPPPQVLENQGWAWLASSSMASASSEADINHPSQDAWIIWNLEEIDHRLSPHIEIHRVALSDEREIKFLEDREGIRIYDSRHGAERCYLGTEQAIRMPGNYHKKLVGCNVWPEQPIPFTTEPIERTPKPMLDSLVSMEADLTRPEEHRTLLRNLRNLEQRPECERWPATEWPSDRAFEDACAFIYALPKSPIPLPHLSIADDGEINFYWGQNGIHIDLGFYGTGTYSYYACGTNEAGLYDNDVAISSGLPGVLLELLGS